MASQRNYLPRPAVRRLGIFLITGSLIGLCAALTEDRGVQLALVMIAVLVGVRAGLFVRRNLQTRER